MSSSQTVRAILFALVVVFLGILFSACSAPTPAVTAVPTSTPQRTRTPVLTETPVLPTATPIPVPPLTWEGLKNVAYPNEWPKDGVAQLTDGLYVEEYMPGAATKLRILLSYLRVYGDLNDDGCEDVAAILVVDPGGSGTFYYLEAVLNGSGDPRPVASQFLGDRVFIRSMKVENGNVILGMDVTGPSDSACCPTDSKRVTYALEGDSLVEVEVVDLPDPEVSARIDNPPRRLEFGPDVTSITIEERIGFNRIKGYLVRALATQVMTVTIESPHDDVWLSIRGSDGTVLETIRSEAFSWSGQLPTTQDYTIYLIAAGGETDYTFRIEISGEGEPEPPEPTATPLPEAGEVVYLTFDDGAIRAWTPQILEVLARYDAKATFFVLGQLAERFPDIIQAEVDAGHTVGNHTYDHHTLDGLSRDAFFQEVQDTEEALGGLGTKCLRPPYGATDAYTRAYAGELGYEIVLWDIDTEDWANPGADQISSTVLTQVFPGAVVLFHDGGGDRAQTVEALSTVLDELRSRGYSFEPVCH